MLRIISQRNIAYYWTGQFISSLGDWIFIVAFPFYVYQLTGSVFQSGITFIIEMLPQILLGPIVGVFVDRWDRRKILIICVLVEALLLYGLLFVHSVKDLWLLYSIAILLNIATVLSTPATRAFVPLIARENELLAVNSLLSLSDSVSRLVGPLLGGILFALAGMGSIVIVDSLTFIIAAICLFMVVLPQGTQTQDDDISSVELREELTFWLYWLLSYSSGPERLCAQR
ncbi:MFS transporter [Tengunoibacter tsumagoiensis]|uniref:Major facilitator superfamily (MFS) profile domain-containing protein n=1 Tax=Tengunoibacter tsumagoiensis TaxID=2014871 RepID=A0A402A3E2_9CHLR|nr:MFS transporter [Tengunoibacter tsumagoiensis]GCE13511.1 hypothetical protein KTT_33700 [Tengunoibacter tsumagoiensis]